jgi:hypothetical protein
MSVRDAHRCADLREADAFCSASGLVVMKLVGTVGVHGDHACGAADVGHAACRHRGDDAVDDLQAADHTAGRLAHGGAGGMSGAGLAGDDHANPVGGGLCGWGGRSCGERKRHGGADAPAHARGHTLCCGLSGGSSHCSP